MNTNPEELDPGILNSLFEVAEQETLEPLAPQEAIKSYAKQREGETTKSTIETHLSRLTPFREWCDANDVTNLNNLTGRNIQSYRNYCKSEHELSPASWESYIRTFRLFLRHCARVDAVPSTLPQKIRIPIAERDARDAIVPPDRATKIINQLETYNYASTEHIVWSLFVEVGLRLSGIRALDIGDHTTIDDGGQLELINRPASDTRLKNGDDSERTVHLSSAVNAVIEDYKKDRREDVTDEYGREPLVTSVHGRLAESTIRKYAYKWTRPCEITGDCPHDYDEDTIEKCPAAQSADQAYQCPSSSSPHSVRRGRITHALNAGVPMPVVSDRYDASPEVIDDYYDLGSKEEKMERRKAIRTSIYQDDDTKEYYK